MSETPALVVDVSLARSMVEPLYRDLTLPTGENVMQHADGIASILREVRDDPELISAAYLFCVPSVIQNSGEWIEKSFGPAVNGLVQELGQVNELSRRARSENEEANTRHQVEAMRRMFLSMCKDLRVVLLKLASRLQTLRWFAASKREGAEKFGTETLDLYAPLANRLGIWQLKWELEDLSLRFTRQSEYREIAQQLDESREQRIEFMQSAVLRIRGLLEENGIKAEVSGRPKHIYSIWKKMQRKHLRFDQLFDVRAVRIIVDTVERCYQVLSIVHENFPVISKEYDDYIAKPFRPRELVSRIRNVLRRYGGGTGPLRLGPIRVDAARGVVTKDGRELPLSPLEYRLLLLFCSNPGVVLSRSRILDEIWDLAGDFVTDNTLTVYMKRLRDKIEPDPQNPTLIRTIRGQGYKAEDCL